MILTIRAKITLVFIATVALLVLLLNILIFESANQTWQRQEAEYMRAQMDDSLSVESARERFTDLEILDASGAVIYQQGIFAQKSLHTPFVSRLFRDESVTMSQGRYYYWGIQTLSGGVVYKTVDDITEIIQMRSMIVERSLVISLLGMLVIFALGYRFSAYVLRPIEDMNSAVERFSLSQKGEIPRIAIDGQTSDQVVRLARSIEALFIRVHREGERLEQFSDDIAHEIKNRLFEILSSLDLASSDDHRDHALKQTRRTIKQLSATVDALLFLSHGARGELVSTPLFPLLKGHIPMDDSRITLVGEQNVRALISSDLFMTAVWNIVGNAQKFTPKNGSIRLSLEPHRLTITDTGKGIAREHLSRIFDRLYQVDEARTSGSGHGLGLSIARKIIEDFHGMTLSVESEVGVGTRFIIAWKEAV